MYIPHQFLITIENERLEAAARRQLLVEACGNCADERALKRHRGLGRRVTRAFRRRPAGATA